MMTFPSLLTLHDLVKSDTGLDSAKLTFQDDDDAMLNLPFIRGRPSDLAAQMVREPTQTSLFSPSEYFNTLPTSSVHSSTDLFARRKIEELEKRLDQEVQWRQGMETFIKEIVNHMRVILLTENKCFQQ